MRTKIAWPETYREIPGMMGFPTEYVDYTAGFYEQRVVPLVTAAITTLENQIDVLKQQNEALKQTIAASKPKVKYCHETGNWIVIKE
jgi:hypothetical protein